LHSTVFNVISRGSNIESVSFVTGGDLTRVKCSSVVDASGEGLVTKLARKPAVKDESYQAPAYVFRISNIEIENSILERDLNLVLLKAQHDFEKSGFLQKEIGRFSIVPG